MIKELTTFCSNTRTSELRSDQAYTHIMKYMGSKRELLPEIKEHIKDIIPIGSTVLDLFAGTGSVGAYLKEDYNIISNDIQNYSQVIATALIKSSSMAIGSKLEEELALLREKYCENKNKLYALFPKTFQKSKKFSQIKKGTWTESDREEYQCFFNKFPSPSNNFKTDEQELKLLSKLYFEYSKNNKKEIYFQTTFLFSETYFSFEQAIDIDSIRYAIDKTIGDEILKSIFLSALIYAYSYCSSGTGHFAMYRELRDLSSVEDTFIYRKKNVWDYFVRKLNEILLSHKYIPDKIYQIYNEDYRTLLKQDFMQDVALVYADPPYSSVHYSRFYHAIESLVKYDYDIPSFKGRYRSDRHQSPFCQTKNVHKAFVDLFQSSYEKKANVLLSYSDTGMIKQEELKEIIVKQGYNFEMVSINYNHSTLGRKNHKSNRISEYLITAKI